MFMHCIHYICVNMFLLFRLTRNQTIAARDRLTIYFHAVLSKHFKFDPNKDQIFIRAGRIIGTWEENTVELFVSRYSFSMKFRWWLNDEGNKQKQQCIQNITIILGGLVPSMF